MSAEVRTIVLQLKLVKSPLFHGRVELGGPIPDYSLEHDDYLQCDLPLRHTPDTSIIQ